MTTLAAMREQIRIGTRESQLAVWQATTVQGLLTAQGVSSSLTYVNSDGDIDLKTPLYEIGVQGIFTRSLDVALLNNEIDIAVHSMKDVPTTMAKGIVLAAVLPRGNYRDILVPNPAHPFADGTPGVGIIATSSIRRKAQWLHRYPNTVVENLRGNVNTRLRKVSESHWNGAIFAAAGLERIHLLPADAVVLDWMLPAPAQGAIVVVCREGDTAVLDICAKFNHEETAIATQIERDFLKELKGGCATPISALALVEGDSIAFTANVLTPDGQQKKEIAAQIPIEEWRTAGKEMANKLLADGGAAILEILNYGK